MGELLEKLGVNPALLLAQAGNFLLVFWLLKRYAFPKILSMIEERRERIEQGLAMSEKAEHELRRIEDARSREFAKAREEAEGVLRSALESARLREREIEAASRLKAEEIIAKARKEAEAEKEEIIAQAEAEMKKLVTSAAEKVLARSLKGEDERRFAEEALRAVPAVAEQ